RNDYNQQLASQIPALKEAAYNQYMNEQNLNLSTLDALRAADDTAYGRYRDDVSDNQWKYGADYQTYRDDVADTQWQTSYDRSVLESDRSFEYQKERDKVADKQWAKEYALAKKGRASSGGSSGGGYLGGSSGGGYLGDDSMYPQAKDAATGGNNNKGNNTKKNTNKYKNVQLGIWDQFLQKQKK
ncbi:MAG: hypothetical protein Q4B18_02600, partial [Bacillota bacterium]|nr:hypothetical protein [Bacillota bacterium]